MKVYNNLYQRPIKKIFVVALSIWTSNYKVIFRNHSSQNGHIINLATNLFMDMRDFDVVSSVFGQTVVHVLMLMPETTFLIAGLKLMWMLQSGIGWCRLWLNILWDITIPRSLWQRAQRSEKDCFAINQDTFVRLSLIFTYGRANRSFQLENENERYIPVIVPKKEGYLLKG